MVRSNLVKGVCAAIALSSLSAPPAGAIELIQGSGPSAELNDGLISKVVVVHRGGTYVGPRGGVYHHGGTWAGHPYGGYGYRGGYGYHGGYGYGGYGYRPYGYGAAAAVGAAAVGAAIVAPHCWINSYGYRVCN